MEKGVTAQFQDIANGRFYLGDCLQVLKEIPDGVIDMICTDPPYGMDFQSNYRIEQHAKIANDKDLDWLPDLVKECYRVAKDNTAHYFFCSFHKLDVFKQALEQHFKVKNILVWEKNNTSMGDLKGDFAPKVEFVFFVHKGRSLIRGKRDPNIFKFARTGNELHPTQKPVDLIEYLVGKFSDEGQCVLDPFAGSGTTAVACENLKRRWVCIEQDETYATAAVERIKSCQP